MLLLFAIYADVSKNCTKMVMHQTSTSSKLLDFLCSHIRRAKIVKFKALIVKLKALQKHFLLPAAQHPIGSRLWFQQVASIT